METRSTPHPLRTITLRYDRTVTAPAFETEALQYYQEIHDRTYELKQRVQKGRNSTVTFQLQVEEADELFREAKRKFDHFKRMIPTNPSKDVVYSQLKTLLAQLSDCINDFIKPMVDEVNIYLEHDNYIFALEEWMDKVAFPHFDQIYKNYTACSVDLALFDLDLEDFKYALGYVKEQEGKYVDSMNELIDTYTALNDEIADFYDSIAEFDESLLQE